MDKVFESLVYVNASGTRVVLSDRSISQYWELRGRSGFTAPTVNLLTQKYVNGREKVVGRIIEPRELSINMVVVGKTTAQRDSIFRDMVAKLMDVSGGENGRLYVTRTDGRTVYINCAYNGGLSVTDEYRKFHKFTLDFYAADPYFYFEYPETGVTAQASTVVTLADDLYLGNWYLGIGDNSGTGVVNNLSSSAVEPVFRISGQRLNLTIRNATTNESLTFTNLTALVGDELVIDTREAVKSAYLIHEDGTTESVMPCLDWSNADMALPLISGGNSIYYETYGEDRPLYVDVIIPQLSA